MSTSVPRIITTTAELRAAVVAARKQGQRIGVVPTMGALHAGHVSLVAAAERECDFVIVTIFVNPTQFGPHEDYQRYPRTLDADLHMLSAHRVEVVFAPTVDQMYVPGDATRVDVQGVALPWEGERRPGHFCGVATIVLKLLLATQADAAYFGRKDLQQSLVVQRMIDDLRLNVELRVCPIVREPDGLAMSSRNAYLSASERQQALALCRALRRGNDLVRQGERSALVILTAMQAVLAAEPQVIVEYLAIVDGRQLAPVEQLHEPVYAIIAARVGATRLIDNERFTF